MQQAVGSAPMATCTGIRMLEAGMVGTERQRQTSFSSPGSSSADAHHKSGFYGAIFLARQPRKLRAAMDKASTS